MTENTNTNAVKSYELSIKAMTDTIEAVNYAIEALDKDTLKKIKESLTTVTSQTANLPIGIKEDIKALNNTKTKKIYIEGLELVKDKVLKSIQLANETIVNIKETAKPELNKDELDKIAKAVKESLKIALDAHFQAGKLLSDALEIFKAAGKSAKDWLEWANLSCSVKKAQAYNLVKIWNDFGQVSEFKGCPMRVLNILVHTSNDLYKKIEEQAKSLAKKGKLDSKAVNSLIDSVKPASKPKPAKPEKSNTVRQEQEQDEQDATTKAIKASIKDDDKNKNNTELSTSQSRVSGTETAEVLGIQVEDDKDALIAELREQNLQLLERIEELTKAVQKTKKEEHVKTAIFLPQFESLSPNLVLGIERNASKEEINKRYRTMAVIFNAKTCPAGAKALKAAKDNMLKTAKN